MFRSVLAVLAVPIVALVGLLATPASALAHSQLVGTDPADGSTVSQQLTHVTLNFNEVIQAKGSTIAVFGPNGAIYSKGKLRVSDNRVTQSVYPLKSGSYTVTWRVVSADGHPVQSQFRFAMQLPAGQEPTSAPPSPKPADHETSNQGMSSLPWVVLAVLVTAVAAVGLTVGGRKRQRQLDKDKAGGSRPGGDDREPDQGTTPRPGPSASADESSERVVR